MYRPGFSRPNFYLKLSLHLGRAAGLQYGPLDPSWTSSGYADNHDMSYSADFSFNNSCNKLRRVYFLPDEVQPELGESDTTPAVVMAISSSIVNSSSSASCDK